MAHAGRDRTPDPLAGLRVDDDDIGALLAELPGLTGKGSRAMPT